MKPWLGRIYSKKCDVLLLYFTTLATRVVPSV